jgi:DNA-directed RNA polymerase subunit RPC12/RpoP
MSGVVCIQCGLEVVDPPLLNRLRDGSNCPACADRVLDAQPAIVHAPLRVVGAGDDPVEHDLAWATGDESPPPERA